jgi:hypothetical protein
MSKVDNQKGSLLHNYMLPAQMEAQSARGLSKPEFFSHLSSQPLTKQTRCRINNTVFVMFS